MKSKSRFAFRNPFLSHILTVAASSLVGTTAHATDYGFGSVTENFTITASDQARVQGVGITASGTLSPDNGAVYDRGGDQDATYMHFNLASLSGMTMNGDVNLNLTVWDNWGGAINNGIIGTAGGTWTTTSAAPGINAFTPTSAPNQTYGNGATATWAISNSTFTGILSDLGNFNGLGITAGDGSNAHFSAPATLTGSYTSTAIRVNGGTDWSAATWTEGTKALAISSGDVSGGNVSLAVGTKLDVTGSATLGSGNFSGSFTNSGTLAFGSSANQILSGAISGSGSLEKSGAGTLTLGGSISYKGGTTVNGGTLALPEGDWHTGNPWDGNGATGAITVGSGATLSTSQGVTEIKNGLTLNGGTVSSRGNYYGTGNGTWGNLVLSSNISAGNSATSTISSEIRLSGNRSVDVGSDSTLNITGGVAIWPNGGTNFGITKTGTGTLALSAANGYNGVTDITAGTLVAASSTALGTGAWNGSTMTWVRDGATLALQGNVSLDEHMHMTGAGVGGLGALRSLSGDNALTLYNGGGSSGPGFALDGNTTVGVDADTLTVTGFYHDSGSYGITKVGNGTLTLSSTSTYTGDTTVSAGTLLVNGELGTSAVTVGPNGTIGGSGLILGSLNFDANAKLTVNLADVLSVNGIVSFDGFGFDDLVNFDVQSVAEGTYTLLSGNNFNFANVEHYGFSNALTRTDGKLAYFQSGSLQVVVVPEPEAALLGGLGLLALLRRRR